MYYVTLFCDLSFEYNRSSYEMNVHSKIVKNKTFSILILY